MIRLVKTAFTLSKWFKSYGEKNFTQKIGKFYLRPFSVNVRLPLANKTFHIRHFRYGSPTTEWISGGFQVDFWISVRISGFQFGFLDFSSDFWISVRISGFRDFRYGTPNPPKLATCNMDSNGSNLVSVYFRQLKYKNYSYLR